MNSFKTQLLTIWQIIVRPRQTLIDLPKHEFFIVGGLINGYFAYARLQRQGQSLASGETIIEKIGGFLLILGLSLVMLWISATVLRWIVMLFGKTLTRKKIMNLLGYSQAPRLVIVTIPLTLAAMLFPEAADNTLLALLGSAQPPIWLILVIVLGAILLLYSFVLLIWGLIISPE